MNAWTVALFWFVVSFAEGRQRSRRPCGAGRRGKIAQWTASFRWRGNARPLHLTVAVRRVTTPLRSARFRGIKRQLPVMLNGLSETSVCSSRTKGLGKKETMVVDPHGRARNGLQTCERDRGSP
jgi:hypothetical protein